MARNPFYVGPGPDIQPEDLDEYEKTGDYIYQPKRDGMWVECTVGEKNILNSRDIDTPPVSGSNAGDLREIQIPVPFGTKFAGELEAASEWSTARVEKTGIRHLFLFDIMLFGDEDLRKLTTEARYQRLADIYHTFSDPLLRERFVLLPSYRDNFRQRYEEEVAAGGEGCVLKRADSKYHTYASSGKTDEWVRCKKTANADFFLLKLTKTPKGTTAGRWGMYVKGKVKDIFQAGPGQRVPAHLLVEENIGKLVCEFEGKGQGKSGALRHAQWCRVRTDKSPEMCIL